MDIRLGCVVVFVTLLCALAIGRCEGRSKSEDSNFFFNNDIPPRIIEEMWEQLRSNCKHDFMQMKSIIEAFGIYIDEDNSIDSKEQVITKVNLQSFINVVPPHLKRSLLDCLQKQNIPVLVSGEEVDSKKWYVSYIESLFGWSDASRRYLGENRLHGTAHSLPLAPALALAPNPAQAPSPAFESPTYAPEQSSGLAPASLYVPNPGPAEEPSASPDINPNEAYSGDLQSSASPSFAPDVPNPGPAEEPSASPDINPNEAYSGDLQSSASPSFAPDVPNPGPAEEPSASPDINPNEAYSGDLQSSASPSFAPDVPNPGPAEEPSASPDINPNEAYSGDLQSSASPSFAPDVPNPGPAEEPSASPDINPNEAYSGDLQSSASPSFAPDVPNPGPAEEPSASPDINPNEAYSGDLQSSASPSFAPDPPPKPHTYLQVAVAVGGTAAGTFAFALVFVACYHRSRKDLGSVDVEKDDNPFLTISLRGDSYGSSRKSSLGGTINKEKSDSLFSGTNSNPSGKFSSLSHNRSMASGLSTIEEASSLGTPGAARSSQESPTASTGGPVMPSPPLKPPPGRASPIPPGPPPPPPIPAPKAPGPPPPPAPKGAGPPRAPPPLKPSTLKPNPLGKAERGEKQDAKVDSEGQKSKLKPFFWDKVVANPDQSMVWHQISSGSFQFDEEMIENLFGHHAANKNKNENKKGLSEQPSPQYIYIIDSRKAQNILILLRALNVTTEEVHDALHEGNDLPTELLQTMLKMAPTQEEELKLRLYSGEISQLGPAERFLKVLVDIPFAFKRMDSLLFKKSLEEEISSMKESLATLEVASKELRNSRLFLKLLEAVLKTGNRMNAGTFRGSAQAFKLDTLLKLADVRGTDGKTTLLHFVVQEIIRSEGKRAARGVSESEFQNIPSFRSQDLVEDSSEDIENYYRSLGLQVVSGLGAELENVRKAAALDADSITTSVSKLGHGLVRSKNFLNSDMQSADEDSKFSRMLKSFVEHAEVEITSLLEEEKRIMSLVKSTVDCFHGSAGKDEGLRLFVIVRDFLLMLDKSCNEVRKSTKMAARIPTNRESPTVPLTTETNKSLSQDLRQRLFPAITDRRMDSFSSDDES
ncbi:Formin-like protein [Thalictrum thalictroides]|uniref:Formin-like protein n=1 Tax=Thalictrum thalictroides TaxID=46969 RepID=A0A7J6VGD7_THATH|nr:Formin-like protein [Thalictrum thalictroides]